MGCSVVYVVLLMQILLVTSVAGFELLILHTNDFHDRVEETNKYSGSCNSKDSAKGKCFGGVSRIKSKVDELRSEYNNSILLDGGDQYQGTLWFYTFGGQILAHFMNIIGYDAIGLGNHEFDMGVSGLVPFVDNASFAVLSSNIDLSDTPELQGKIAKSKTFTIADAAGNDDDDDDDDVVVVVDDEGEEEEKDDDADDDDDDDDDDDEDEDKFIQKFWLGNKPAAVESKTVKFTDELTAVQAEANRLMGEGVNKIIALGHQGFVGDQDMARSLNGVDVIVGGHSNTFLYSGEAPSNEESSGSYPFIVKTSASEENVLVVQNYAFGKYLGSLHLTFDDAGKVTNFNGNPVLLDSSVPKDPELESLVNSFLPQIEAEKSKPVGSTHVLLQGDRKVCRVRECNLGNLICDGMLRQNLRHSDDTYWSDVGIAMINSGGIRSSLEIGAISNGDVIQVQPFRNTVDIVELRGETVLKILEFGASQWTEVVENLYGGFLQVSGMRIVYDMTRESGSRVVDVQMRCTKCKIPHFEPLNKTEVYQIVMTNFLAEGNNDLQILIDTIKQDSPVIQGLDGRIRFLQEIKADSLTSKLVQEKECVSDSAPEPDLRFPVELTTTQKSPLKDTSLALHTREIKCRPTQIILLGDTVTAGVCFSRRVRCSNSRPLALLSSAVPLDHEAPKQYRIVEIHDLVKYIRENFEKKYADEIAKGTYDERDLERLREDSIFARTYIRGKDRLDEGVELLHTSLKFRKDIGVNDLTEYSFEEELWQVGGMFFRNRDIEGKRILWLRVKLHFKNATADRLEKEKKAIMFGLEKAFNENPLGQIVVMLDMTSCGLVNLDMDFVKYIITIFKFYYPTFLGYMLIYDMPWIFNAAWKIVKAWLSAEAAAKIKFVTKSDVQTYVLAKDLPDYMGGTDIFTYYYQRGLASERLYPEEDMKKQDKKQVTFQEAREPSTSTDSQEGSSSTDHNANSSSDNGIRKRNTSNSSSLNRNNNANEKKLTKISGFPEPGSLLLSPADELSFQTSAGGDSFDTITLTNTLTHPVAYKVKTTSPEKFRVRPSSGIINPRKTEEVYVYLVQDHTTDVGKDKFLIMAMEVKPGSGTDPNQLFKEASKDKIMQHKLMCSEEGQKKEQTDFNQVTSPAANEPLMAKGREFKPGPQSRPESKTPIVSGHDMQSTVFVSGREVTAQKTVSDYSNGFSAMQRVGDDDIDKQVEQLERQTLHMQRQLNLLLAIQILTAVTFILIMLAYSCLGEELFTRFLGLPFDFCNDPYGRKC
ncbi:5'-nucleotidase [Elysia marginata]|uniref:5'-nucleotidase n=1 Tax=Elysia marginata TaxID=1093978 RepID=A0AAV4FIQ0_9GAST|nr:5'-nucleotidase [Elysia marginata]